MSESESEGETVIESGIPIPPTWQYYGYHIALLRKMKHGESVFMTDRNRVTGLLKAGKAYGIGVVTRKQPGGGWRVWRVGKREHGRKK